MNNDTDGEYISGLIRKGVVIGNISDKEFAEHMRKEQEESERRNK